MAGEADSREWTRETRERGAKMKREIAVIIMLTLLLGASMSQGQWKMRVHEGETTTEFWVSGIDSVKFQRGLVPEMVVVPAGSFLQGDGHAYCGNDERGVTLTRDFHLGQYEVTNQEYLEMLQWAYDSGYVTATAAEVRDNLDGSTEQLLDLDDWGSEISFSGGTFTVDGGKEDHPVKEVTWYGAARYCDWLSEASGLDRAYEHSGDWLCNEHDPYGAEGYRLPTDAEWEYAAQHNDDRIYPWGDEAPDCSRVNYWPSSPGCVGWTSPVGSYPDAPASLGLSDMAGNVWEWCNDWWVCDLGEDPEQDPVGNPTGTYRVSRGGSWHDLGGRCRCACRWPSLPDYNTHAIGFRVARTVAE